MRAWIMVLPLASAVAMQAPAVLAQTNPPPALSSAKAAPAGSLEKVNGALRASEVVGANVYNDEGAVVGTVNDILLGEQGGAQNVVLSVGGFIGLGTRYVSVPFSELKIVPSRAGSAGMLTNAAPGDTPTASGAPTTANAGATTMGMRPPGAATPKAMASQKAYFSLVMPGASKDSLMKMPAYSYPES